MLHAPAADILPVLVILRALLAVLVLPLSPRTRLLHGFGVLFLALAVTIDVVADCPRTMEVERARPDVVVDVAPVLEVGECTRIRPDRTARSLRAKALRALAVLRLPWCVFLP